ncbi:MAG: MBL fold metallo-hydrolase, partial [Chloroflexi bacterium]|nr:MBL fold metallo-hydrolase [Chloroflexota bacterium]
MQVTFLGHAGFCVETEAAVVLMDPWLSPTGAFDGGWFQLPRNEHLTPLVQQKMAQPGRRKYVYISHEHKDHFDLPFLESLEARDFTLLVGRFQRRELENSLSSYACVGLLACEDGERIPIPGGYIKLFLDDSGLNRDSGILVKAGDGSFLNLNDCKIYDRLQSVIDNDGPIDAFTCQFSGATWHPTCYEYPRPSYERIARRKMFSKFESVAQAIRILRPRTYLPSAGPACFLDPDLIHLNFEAVNIFPRARTFINYLDRRLSDLATSWPDVSPGDVLDVVSGDVAWQATERVDDVNFASYIATYAADRHNYLHQLKHGGEAGRSPCEVLELLQLELQRKLEHFPLAVRLNVPLYVGLTELRDVLLEVNFKENVVKFIAPPEQRDFYRVLIPGWEASRVASGRITWEDLSLTFRARLKREPDVYQTMLQAFLILEPDDL